MRVCRGDCRNRISGGCTSARCCTFSTRSKHTAPFHRLRPRSRPNLHAPRCPRQATSPVAWCNDVGALGLTASGEGWATGEWGMVWFRIFSLPRAGIDYRRLLAWLAAGPCRALSPSSLSPSLSETLWRLTHSYSPCLCWSYLLPGRDARRAALWRFQLARAGAEWSSIDRDRAHANLVYLHIHRVGRHAPRGRANSLTAHPVFGWLLQRTGGARGVSLHNISSIQVGRLTTQQKS
mmetsp:Transcript_28749/g.92825  ORF Transcript_28749/g.92825 Transcript_28749/m.92825 type:complete len:236 (+) Transcript_28749:316-1023(+)